MQTQALMKNNMFAGTSDSHTDYFTRPEGTLAYTDYGGNGELVLMLPGVGALRSEYRFQARLCSAWDFGLLPRGDTIAEIRHAEWCEAVDECRLLTSPTYHLLRPWHGLDRLPYLGQHLPYIRDDPNLKYV